MGSIKNLLRSKRFLGFCSVIFIAGTVSSLFCRARSLPVWSSSMAPAFEGPSLRFQCPRCGSFHFMTVDRPFGSKIERTRFARCPGCGFAEVPVSPNSWVEGESVRVAPHGFDFGPFHRWEPVAFELSDEEENGTVSEGIAVEQAASDTAASDKTARRRGSEQNFSKRTLGLKRVVGLPGETVEIDRGDLRVNGRIAAKPNFDFARVPLPTVRPVRLPDRILFQNRPPKPFLTGEEPQGGIPTPITNLPAAERIEPIPLDRIENVRDFILEFPFPFEITSNGVTPGRTEPFETTSNGTESSGVKSNEMNRPPLQILANQGDRFWLVVLDVKNNRAVISQRPNSEPEQADEAFAALSPDSFPADSARTVSLQGKSGRFILAFCDRLAVLQVQSGREITELARIPERADAAAVSTVTATPTAMEPTTVKNPPITTPFAIVADSSNGGNDKDAGTAPVSERQLETFRVFRDLHYSVPSNGRSQWTLGDDDYLLLGDNAAVSRDARDWKHPTVPRNRIHRISRTRTDASE